jgi:hypothetical protein
MVEGLTCFIVDISEILEPALIAGFFALVTYQNKVDFLHEKE